MSSLPPLPNFEGAEQAERVAETIEQGIGLFLADSPLYRRYEYMGSVLVEVKGGGS